MLTRAIPVCLGALCRVIERDRSDTDPLTPVSRRCTAWALLGILLLLVCGPLGTRASADTCEPGWASLTGQEIGVSGEVRAMAVFDDGAGPALYAGGIFTTAGGVEVNRIARWNGSTWSALEGPSGIGLNGTLRALAVFDDGSGPALYAGGNFTTAGGVTVNGVAKWDGTEWSALNSPGGTGVATNFGYSPYVEAFAVFDDGSGSALYVGGRFTTAGGVTVHSIAKWDGTEWSALSSGGGTGVSGNAAFVSTLAVFDDGSGPALFAGGSFTSAGGAAANFIAKWDGSVWAATGGPSDIGVNGSVFALVVFDDDTGPALYLGGQFTQAGGIPASRIARWNGSAWSSLGLGLGFNCRALTVFDDGLGSALYAAGSFLEAGGSPANRIARWDGSAWSPLGDGVSSGISAMSVYDDGSGPALYVGGSFSTAGDVEAVRIARWDGVTWSALNNDPNDTVDTITVTDHDGDEHIYVGGSFTAIGNQNLNRIAMWDGSAWHPLIGINGNGVGGGFPDTQVNAITIFDDGTGSAVYVGGNFTGASGVGTSNIARWDGQSWSPLVGPNGQGVNGLVHAIVVHDDGSGPALYVGGRFTTAGGLTANRVARWDGSAWSALGTGTNNDVYAMTVYDDGSGPALYAAGRFTSAGGQPAARIARWNGATWSALGAGLTSPTGTPTALALTVADDGNGPALYVGGTFAFAGGIGVNRVARWNGSAWSSVGGGVSGLSVQALTPFNDGTGPALAVGGEFNNTVSGVPARRVALYNAHTGWRELDPGDAGPLNNSVFALATTTGTQAAPAKLLIGGQFTGSPSGTARLATWQGCFVPTFPCPADLTGPSLDGVPDGTVNAFDLNYYIALWLAGDLAADLTGPALDGVPDGAVNAFDLNYYLDLWLNSQGPCP